MTCSVRPLCFQSNTGINKVNRRVTCNGVTVYNRDPTRRTLYRSGKHVTRRRSGYNTSSRQVRNSGKVRVQRLNVSQTQIYIRRWLRCSNNSAFCVNRYLGILTSRSGRAIIVWQRDESLKCCSKRQVLRTVKRTRTREVARHLNLTRVGETGCSCSVTN